MAESVPTDLTSSTQQGTAEHEVFPPFDSSNYPSEILFLALAFGVLYYCLSKTVLPNFAALFAARKRRIDDDFAEAARHKAESETIAKAYEAQMNEARASAAVIAAEARASVKAEIDGRQKVADEGFARQLADAEAQIVAARTEALGSVDAIAAEAAAAVATRLLGREVGLDDVAAAVAATPR